MEEVNNSLYLRKNGIAAFKTYLKNSGVCVSILYAVNMLLLSLRLEVILLSILLCTPGFIYGFVIANTQKKQITPGYKLLFYLLSAILYPIIVMLSYGLIDYFRTDESFLYPFAIVVGMTTIWIIFYSFLDNEVSFIRVIGLSVVAGLVSGIFPALATPTLTL